MIFFTLVVELVVVKYGLFLKGQNQLQHKLCFYTPTYSSSPAFKEKVTLKSFVHTAVLCFIDITKVIQPTQPHLCSK